MMIKNKPLCLLCNVTATGRQAAVSSVSVPDLVQLHSHSDNSQSVSLSIHRVESLRQKNKRDAPRHFFAQQ